MPQHPFHAKTALITGASSGIGFELARLFLKAGSNVILIGSNPKKLEDAAARLEKEHNAKVMTIAKDLSLPHSAAEIFETTQKWGKSIDILVNNAGIGVSGYFHASSSEELLKMTDLNVRSVLALTRAYIPGMVERGFGRILNVASTAAFQAVPIEAAYAATKAYVLVLSESLHDELNPKGIGVTCLCPGPTETLFFERGSFAASHVMRRMMMSSQKVAEIGFKALEKRKPLVIAGLRNKIAIFGERLIPRNWVTKIARRMVE